MPLRMLEWRDHKGLGDAARGRRRAGPDGGGLVAAVHSGRTRRPQPRDGRDHQRHKQRHGLPLRLVWQTSRQRLPKVDATLEMLGEGRVSGPFMV